MKNFRENNQNLGEDYSDILPAGTFFAPGELTGEQVRAIKFVREIGQALIQEHPEIAAMYRDKNKCLTYEDIAKLVLPDLQAKYPEVAKKSIGYAMRLIIPMNEISELTRLRMKDITENIDFTSQAFIEQCKQAAAIRHQKHGVNVQAMLEARGRTAWSVEEIALVKKLISDPEFQHKFGSIRGTPNYSNIAIELNRVFHNGKETRYANSVASLVRDWHRKKNKDAKRTI